MEPGALRKTVDGKQSSYWHLVLIHCSNKPNIVGISSSSSQAKCQRWHFLIQISLHFVALNNWKLSKWRKGWVCRSNNIHKFIPVKETQSCPVLLNENIKIPVLLFRPACALIMLCACVCVCVLVAELIHITVQPQSQQATLGGRVVLTCRASGPPGLSYQWFRGKEEVSLTFYYNVNIKGKRIFW